MDKAAMYMKVEENRKNAIKEIIGYSNEENPFGDKNLAQPFIWNKKKKKDKEAGKDE